MKYPKYVVGPLGILRPVFNPEEARRHGRYTMTVAVIFAALMVGAWIMMMVMALAFMVAGGVL